MLRLRPLLPLMLALLLVSCERTDSADIPPNPQLSLTIGSKAALRFERVREADGTFYQGTLRDTLLPGQAEPWQYWTLVLTHPELPMQQLKVAFSQPAGAGSVRVDSFQAAYAIQSLASEGLTPPASPQLNGRSLPYLALQYFDALQQQSHTLSNDTLPAGVTGTLYVREAVRYYDRVRAQALVRYRLELDCSLYDRQTGALRLVRGTALGYVLDLDA